MVLTKALRLAQARPMTAKCDKQLPKCRDAAPELRRYLRRTLGK